MRPIEEPYHYVGCGLDYVYLKGIPYVFCETCKQKVAAIPNEKDLLEKLALFLIAQPIRIGSAELRFLRSVVGWTQSELGSHVHVDRVTVNRWESEKMKYDPPMSVVIRLAFLGGLLRQFKDDHENTLQDAAKQELERLAMDISQMIDEVRGVKRVYYDAETGEFQKAA